MNRGGLTDGSPLRVAILSDDAGMAAPLAATLVRERYAVSSMPRGDEAMAVVRADQPDLVVLDLDADEAEAVDELDQLRGVPGGGFRGAVLALSPNRGELHRVDVLDSGADDLVVKPFSLAELLARARALLRRARSPAVRNGAELVVDHAGRQVFVNLSVVNMTSKEFDVLAMLTSADGAVVPRERLLEEIWSGPVGPKTLDMTIARIRAKLRAAGSRIHVAAVRGVGFRLQPLPEDGSPVR